LGGDEYSSLPCNGHDILAIGGLGVVVVKGFEVFLELERGIKL
jgi:hypothetical protein